MPPATPDQLIAQLNWRYATKQFDPAGTLSDDEIRLLDESLRLAPSSFGLQPWTFVVVNDPKLREQMVAHSWGQRQVADAARLYVLCRRATLTGADVTEYVHDVARTTGTPRESLSGYEKMMTGFVAKLSGDQLVEWSEKQVYIALGSLMTAAAAAGIDTCPMEGFERAKVDELLNLPAMGLRSVVMCPAGRRAATDKYAARKKVRWPREKVFLEI